MKKIRKKGGYSSFIANEYVTSEKPIYTISTELTPQHKFEDGKITSEISSYKIWVCQEGLPPFEVKFSEIVELPTFLTSIEFVNLEACEVNNNIYFKADDIIVK